MNIFCFIHELGHALGIKHTNRYVKNIKNDAILTYKYSL